MAPVAKTRDNPLVPSPKALEKALEQSAKQTKRMADAFGLTVPGTKTKTKTRTGNGTAKAG